MIIINVLLLLLFLCAPIIILMFFSVMYQKSSNKFVKLLCVILAISAMSAYLSIWIWLIKEESKETAAKEAQKRLWVEYKAKGHVKPWLSCDDKVKLGPYLKRPILVINEESMELDELHFQLPSELWPTTPDNVGTAILLKWDIDLVGEYTNGGAAFASTCLVRIFDQSQLCLVKQMQFSTSPPGTITRHSRSGFPLGERGEKPISEVLNYINEMMKQP